MLNKASNAPFTGSFPVYIYKIILHINNNKCIHVYLIVTSTPIIINIKIRATGIHKGEVTHHQDQVMTPTSFSTKKIRNRTVPSPTPLLELLIL